MYKPFTNQKLLFSEYCYDGMNNVQHYCDDIFFIKQYSKDRTFNELRRDEYFKSQCYTNKHNLLEWYTSNQNRLKNLNRQVHNMFRSGKKIYINTILKNFDIVTVNRSKRCFKTELTNGCFIYESGNQKCFVAENSDYYFAIHWLGS